MGETYVCRTAAAVDRVECGARKFQRGEPCSVLSVQPGAGGDDEDGESDESECNIDDDDEDLERPRLAVDM